MATAPPSAPGPAPRWGPELGWVSAVSAACVPSAGALGGLLSAAPPAPAGPPCVSGMDAKVAGRSGPAAPRGPEGATARGPSVPHTGVTSTDVTSPDASRPCCGHLPPTLACPRLNRPGLGGQADARRTQTAPRCSRAWPPGRWLLPLGRPQAHWGPDADAPRRSGVAGTTHLGSPGTCLGGAHPPERGAEAAASSQFPGVCRPAGPGTDSPRSDVVSIRAGGAGPQGAVSRAGAALAGGCGEPELTA